MNVYLRLLLVACVVVYCVDLSGFTESWRNLLARWLRKGAGEKWMHLQSGEDLKPLPPFDCGKCATWWACLIYSLCTGELTLLTVAASALLSLLSDTIAAALLFIHESIGWLFDKLTPR